MPKPATPWEPRFWSKVDKSAEGGCWYWTGGSLKGYGTYTYRVSRDKNITGYAHRIAWSILVGAIPPDMTLDHICRRRICVNPAHLRVCTRGDNVRFSPNTLVSINIAKTECTKGHPLDCDNTYIERGKYGPKRHCKTCRKAQMIQFRKNHPGYKWHRSGG